MFINGGSDKKTVEFLNKSLGHENDDDKPQKRVIVLKGAVKYLDKIEEMLGYMEWLGSVGHSTSFKVFVDGDGAFHLDMKKDNKSLMDLWCKDKTRKAYLRENDDDIDSFDFD
jgi:hypothetical protein